MPFTNLNRKIDRNRSYAPKKKGFKRFWKRILITLIILFVVVYLPARGAYGSSKSLIQAARLTSEGVKNENLDTIKKGVTEMKKSNDGLNTSLGFLFWLGFIPYFGGFYSDAKHLSQAAAYDLTAGQKIVAILEPHKNELGLTGQPRPGQDKIALLVKVLDKIIPELDQIEGDLKKAGNEVSSIDTKKYPETFGKFRVRSQMEVAKNFIGGAYAAVSQGRDALKVAPSALGQPTAKNYLLIFQNDKELRPTGGFMTAYAFLKLDSGRVSSSTSDDIYRLDEKLLKVCLNKICPLTPPKPIVDYLPEVNGKPRTAWSMRDSNLSPDLPTSAKEFERMYALLGEGTPFDGIIFIDTHVVEELIKVTGPLEIFGTKYSAEKDNRCNCPNVVYELENYAQIIEKGEQDRKAILGTLMQELLAKSLGSSTDKMPEFVNTGIELANKKHIMFYMHDPATQTALSKLNWTGEIKQAQGDYLHINDSNFAGGKSNIYVEENVKLEVNIDSSGNVKDKITIEYKNPQPFNTWLNGINRDYVRVYVPKGSKLISSKGSDVPVTTIEDDLGKTAFEAFIQVRPQNSRTLSLEYQLPDKVSGKKYPILIQKQPGTKDFNYEIKINGKKKTDFKLTTDQQLTLDI